MMAKVQADGSLVQWLSSPNQDGPGRCGQKAARLAGLMAAGFPVPDGFCIASEAYREHAGQASVPSPQAAEESQQPVNQAFQDLLEVELNSNLVNQVLESYRHLTERFPGKVAVRSSATAEDLPGHSFAGLYDTVLNVRDETSLLDAIRRCWASYWSEEAVIYRERIGVDHADHSMAVLVQSMVQSRFAGVMFTQAPTHEVKGALALEFVEGGGEALVSGDAKASRYVIDRETGRTISKSSHGPDMAQFLVDRLVSQGMEIELDQGCPQDIEWCVDESDRVWIVQTRPIAAAAGVRSTPRVDGSEKLLLAYDEPFSTLGCELVIQRHQQWVEAINEFHKTAFKPKISEVDGFLYWDPSWRSAKGPLKAWMTLWKVIRWLDADRIYRKYKYTFVPAHLQRVEQVNLQKLSELDSITLMSRFEASIEGYLNLQRISLAANGIAVTSADVLDRLCRLWFRKPNTARASVFLTGLDNLTVERDLALHRLGRTLGEVLTSSEIAILNYRDLSELKYREGAGQRFSEELEAFLDNYGYVWADRYPRDPAWEIDQDALVASLANVSLIPMGAGLPFAHEDQKQRRVEVIERASKHLSSRGPFSLRWPVFRWVLGRAKRFFPGKEDRNHHVYQAVMVIRKYSQEIGRRLAQDGVLESQEDIFFLTSEEIRDAFSGSSKAAVLRSLAKERRLAHRESWLQARDSVVPAEPRDLGRAHDGGTEFVGEPCSPGVASGPVRLVNGLGELFRVQPGDIMVCTAMRPAWSPVLARAGGVVVEEGSLLSHGATLAREYGVPAVLNIPGITQLVRDGLEMVVDGNRGTVSIVETTPGEL